MWGMMSATTKTMPARSWALAFLLTLLGGCGTAPSVSDLGELFDEQDGAPAKHPADLANIADATPRVEPLSKWGNPSSYIVNGKRYHTLRTSRGYVERGVASWYGTKFHGRRTSSGEPYDMYAMTAAHKTLPIPSYVQVTNLENGRKIIVKVNDRGPFHNNRIIDLSYAAAHKLGILGAGTGLVEMRAIDPRAPAPLPTTSVAAAETAPDTTNLYLQVGAFMSRMNAENLRARLRGAAQTPIQISPTLSNRVTVYRVRIGPIQTVEEADRLADNLADMGISEPRVILD